MTQREIDAEAIGFLSNENDRLRTILRDFVQAASLVEANWESSGLAEAVRFLLARRDEANAVLVGETR